MNPTFLSGLASVLVMREPSAPPTRALVLYAKATKVRERENGEGEWRGWGGGAAYMLSRRHAHTYQFANAYPPPSSIVLYPLSRVSLVSQLDPTDFEISYNYGNALRTIRGEDGAHSHRKEAVEQYKKVLRVNPTHVHTMYVEGRRERKRG